MKILGEIIISGAVTHIPKRWAAGSLQLERIELPNTVTFVGMDAFTSPSKLTIVFHGTKEELDAVNEQSELNLSDFSVVCTESNRIIKLTESFLI